ncbi:MAG: NAD(+) synthase [Ruminococcus sp.]
MNYGFIRVAAATPKIRVADCKGNGQKITELIKEANEDSVSVIVFPELCITGYTCSDLFLQKSLLNAAENTLKEIINSTKDMNIISIIGVPVPYEDALYNCAAVCLKGRILALVPKINIPNYTEFYEQRHFTSGAGVLAENFSYAGQKTLIASKAVFSCKDFPEFRFGCEVCEDLWVADSPSADLAENGGALMIFNPSTSDDVIGKAQYRRDLVKMQSGKLCCAYIFADSGFGESTTDMVFSGQNMICENATFLAESKRFTTGAIYADVDLQRLDGERRRISTFSSDKEKSKAIKKIEFSMPVREFELSRTFPKTPFVPSVKTDLESRCEEIINMQSTGLATRLEHTGIKNVVLGLSGGLDSTLALIVCVHAFDMLHIDRKNIHTVTMPCFGTTKRTKSNAEKLAEAYGVSFEEINITNSVRQHFDDIGQSENLHDITYENCQARERTQVLMDLSNKLSALVIGTGDLSELALGWATYNGDHMSMYAVNCSVPKTLVRYLTAYEASKSMEDLQKVLLDILDTPVSPELLPPEKDGTIAQKTEDVVGPYELHDFFLYYFVRFGYTPSKIFYLAVKTFKDDYDRQTIKKWLLTFLRRFFTQQFKRSCIPDGPKIGSVTLSPRGDWRMPSDALSKLWIDELENL